MKKLNPHELLKIEQFCYTMHCIIDHSPLTIEDVLAKDDVWIELKVDYQFFMD